MLLIKKLSIYFFSIFLTSSFNLFIFTFNSTLLAGNYPHKKGVEQINISSDRLFSLQGDIYDYKNFAYAIYYVNSISDNYNIDLKIDNISETFYNAGEFFSKHNYKSTSIGVSRNLIKQETLFNIKNTSLGINWKFTIIDSRDEFILTKDKVKYYAFSLGPGIFKSGENFLNQYNYYIDSNLDFIFLRDNLAEENIITQANISFGFDARNFKFNGFVQSNFCQSNCKFIDRKNIYDNKLFVKIGVTYPREYIIFNKSYVTFNNYSLVYKLLDERNEYIGISFSIGNM